MTRAPAGAGWPVPGSPARTGTVQSFDDDRGVGVVADEEGTRYPFHCTAIADGSRTIVAGTRVSFVLAPGHLGICEGRNLSPLR